MERQSGNMGGTGNIFAWTWNIWGSRTEHTSKLPKMTTFARNYSVKMTWDCLSQFLLLWIWCQGFWGSSEDCYRSKRVSQMLLMCYNLLNSQNILIKQWQWKMVGYRKTFAVAKKAAEVTQKKQQKLAHDEFYL